MYGNITNPVAGKDNIAGLTRTIYLARLSDFTTVQNPPAIGSGAALGDEAKIVTAHVFPVGKGFFGLYNTQTKGKYMVENNGGEDGEGFTFKASFNIPGTDPKVSEFLRNAKNDDWIILLKDPNDKYIQFGSKDIPVKIKCKFDSGELGGNNVKGWTVEMSTFGNVLVEYTASVTLAP